MSTMKMKMLGIHEILTQTPKMTMYMAKNKETVLIIESIRESAMESQGGKGRNTKIVPLYLYYDFFARTFS